MNDGTRSTQHAQWIALAAVVALAASFRLYALDVIPPGLHYDEAIDAHLAQDIRMGARPVFFTQGWGREPLYYYLVAVAMNWLGPAMALRVTSATLGTLFVALAFLLLRELLDWRVAAIGGAWLACSFWVMAVSRLGLRDVAVEPLAAGAMLMLWRIAGRRSQAASRKSQVAGMALGGALLGLSLHTYQVSRALPLLVVLWVVYLAIFQREQLARQWKGLVVFGIVTAIVAAPLATFLVTHPGAESGRNFQSEPILQMLQGKPGPMLEHVLATLGMFTFSGDPQPLYNVPGRPALTLLAGLMFYMGLIVAMIRFKRQEYAFVVLWLVAGLAPALITFPAPNFPRTLLAHLPVGASIAIALVTLDEILARFVKRQTSNVILAILVAAAIGQTALQTWNDYFITWANLKEVRFQYNAGPAAVARYLDASSDTDPVILAGLFVDDSDPYNFEMMLKRADLDLRWFDASSALPVSSGAQTMRLVLYDFTQIDDTLRAHYLDRAAQLTEEQDVFVVYRLNADLVRADLGHGEGHVRSMSEALLELPVSFGDVSLLGYDITPVARGGTLTLVTRWRVNNPGTPQPAAIFVHVVDARGKIVAQDDRLGYPHHGWKPGDLFAQLHRVNIPKDIPPGQYRLKLGIYYQDTDARWPVAGGDSVFLNDRVTLTEAQ